LIETIVLKCLFISYNKYIRRNKKGEIKMENEKYPHLDDFINHKITYDDIAKNTIINYPIDLKKFLDFTEGNLIANKNVFDSFINHLFKEKKEARSTINRRISAIKSFYNYLYDEEIVEVNYGKKIKYLKTDPIEPKKIMKQKEIFKILDGINHLRNKAILETIYTTGIRESELTDLDIENIDFENQLIAVIKAKGRKTRVIPINESSLKLIKAYIGVRKSGPVFLNNRRGRLTPRSIITICHKYFDFPPHDLRHSFATHMIAKTGNIKAVSELLGHSSIQITEKTYTHLSSEYLKDIYKGQMDRD
jgi:site-specific recombinase XerD